MKTALILMHHGLGDLIIATPHFRELHRQGYEVDLMCRIEAKTSHLFDSCPYVRNIIEIQNPWRSRYGFREAEGRNNALWKVLRTKYDWSGRAPHKIKNCISGIDKIDINTKELFLDIPDDHLEVFIPNEIQSFVDGYLEEIYPDNSDEFIYQHTYIEFHEEHTWDPEKFITKYFKKDLPIFDSGTGQEYYLWKNDIRYLFAVLNRAKHIVLGSSVMVHAADALGKTIDVINYGKGDHKVWPRDQSRVKSICEHGVWLKEYN